MQFSPRKVNSESGILICAHNSQACGVPHSIRLTFKHQPSLYVRITGKPAVCRTLFDSKDAMRIMSLSQSSGIDERQITAVLGFLVRAHAKQLRMKATALEVAVPAEALTKVFDLSDGAIETL